MTNKDNGGPAFGSLHDWFMGQALSNPAICTGEARPADFRRWFGERGGVTRAEIMAAQARDVADAVLEARKR